MSSNKQEALAEIAHIAKSHGLSADDVMSVFSTAKMKEQKISASSSILMKSFGFLGGILVFAGLCIFGAMIWDDVGSAGRIFMTLGIGFCTFIMALTCARRDRLEQAATPLFLVAALLQSGGILVLLREMSQGGEPVNGIIFMALVMLLQQGITFIATRRTVLALTSLIFGATLFTALADKFDVPDNLAMLVLSSAFMFIAWALDHSRHRALSGLVYFFGSAGLFITCYDILRGAAAEILYLGICAGMVFFSTVAKSRILLINATLATLGYVGYFSNKYFADSLGWPVVIILMGLMLIGGGILAVRINNKFIRES